MLTSSRWSKKCKLQDSGLLGYNNMLLGQDFQMFRWNMVPSSLSLKKKVLCSFETSENLNPATERYILEDLNLSNNKFDVILTVHRH